MSRSALILITLACTWAAALSASDDNVWGLLDDDGTGGDMEEPPEQQENEELGAGEGDASASQNVISSAQSHTEPGVFEIPWATTPATLSNQPSNTNRGGRQSVLMHFGRHVTCALPTNRSVLTQADRPLQCRFCEMSFKDAQGRGGHERMVRAPVLAEARECVGSEFYAEELQRQAAIQGRVYEAPPQADTQEQAVNVSEVAMQDDLASEVQLEAAAPVNDSSPAAKVRKDGCVKQTRGSAKRFREDYITKRDHIHIFNTEYATR